MSAYSMEVKRLPCIPCVKWGVQIQPFCTEADHANEQQLAGHKRRGDKAQLPSCGWHHRGLLLPGWSRADMAVNYGPSMAHEQKRFRQVFGTDDEMIAEARAQVDRLLPATA